MARVTVEDCILKVPNRFNLVMMAAHRARVISVNSDLTVERDNDKNPVVALREIAEETIPLDGLRDSIVTALQDCSEPDERVEDDSRFDNAETPLGDPVLAAIGDQPAAAPGDDGTAGDGLPDAGSAAGEAGTDGAAAPEDPWAGGFEDMPEEDLQREC